MVLTSSGGAWKKAEISIYYFVHQTNSNITRCWNIRNNSTLDEYLESHFYFKIFFQSTASDVELTKYPLALKMMFNYDIQSNAMSILRGMYKETIPARSKRINDDADPWEKM